MFLTIDGYSGSGKSTQLQALTKAGFHYVDQLWMSLAFQHVSMTKRLNNAYATVLAELMAFNCLPDLSQHNRSYVCDHFWGSLFDIYCINPDAFPEILAFFKTGLALSDRHEPDLSIFLDVPHSVATKRRFRRNTGISVVAPDKADAPFVQFWQVIAETTPCFHRVNGQQPVDSVTHDILRLVEKTRHTP